MSLLTNLLRPLYKFFRSIKLAAALILYLIAISIITSIRPLGMTIDELSPSVSFVLILFPVMLFTLNLTLCAVSRVIGHLRSGSYLHHLGWLRIGPDLVHIAILLFLIGGLMSHYGRIDGEVRLEAGDIAALNKNYLVRLVDFEIELYDDGRPKQYVSSIQLLKRESEQTEATVIDSAEITVNRPYDLGGLKIYQRSYTSEGMHTELATVLQAVYDPGYPAILAGILMFFIGISFITVHRLR